MADGTQRLTASDMKTAVNVAANDFDSGLIFAFDSIGCGFRAAETRRDWKPLIFRAMALYQQVTRAVCGCLLQRRTILCTARVCVGRHFGLCNREQTDRRG